MTLSSLPNAHPPLAALAAGLIKAFGLEGLPQAVVLVPTRRIVLALEQELLQQADETFQRKAVLLPNIVSISDLTAVAAALGVLPPPLYPSPQARKLELAGMLQEERNCRWPQAQALADTLLPLLDTLDEYAITIKELESALSASDGAAHQAAEGQSLLQIVRRWQENFPEIAHPAHHTRLFWQAAAEQLPDTRPIFVLAPITPSPLMQPFYQKIAAHRGHQLLLEEPFLSTEVSLPAEHPQYLVNALLRELCA